MQIALDGGKRYVELQHKHFLVKVVATLGEEVSAKFSALIEIPGPQGGFRQSPAYVFPKREATLMAMSYSSQDQSIKDSRKYI